MKVLVLEDMPDRLKVLDKVHFIQTKIWTKTVAEFIAAYETKPRPDLIILDHDLGGPFMDSKDADEKTGQHAVDYLLQKGHLPPVLVWSINPVGAPLMMKRLRAEGHRSEWIPYYIVKKSPTLTLSRFIE